MILETKRLILRPWEESDAQDYINTQKIQKLVLRQDGRCIRVWKTVEKS